MCSGFPRPPSDLIICQASQIQHILVLTAKSYCFERIQSNVCKGERYVGQSLGETRCKSLLQVKSHRTCFILPVMKCENMFLSTREAHQKLSSLGFYQMLITQAPFTQHMPKFQTLERKAAVQHKSYSLYKQSSQVLNPCKEVFASQVPRCQQRANLEGRPF